jgi:hypothetical protein
MLEFRAIFRLLSHNFLMRSSAGFDLCQPLRPDRASLENRTSSPSRRPESLGEAILRCRGSNPEPIRAGLGVRKLAAEARFRPTVSKGGIGVSSFGAAEVSDENHFGPLWIHPFCIGRAARRLLRWPARAIRGACLPAEQGRVFVGES